MHWAASVVIEAKGSIETRDAGVLAEQLSSLTADLPDPGGATGGLARSD